MDYSGTSSQPNLSDPTLPAAKLAELAATRPDLYAQILGHPACYPELREWIIQRSAQSGQQAASQGQVAQAAASPQPVMSQQAAYSPQTVYVAGQGTSAPAGFPMAQPGPGNPLRGLLPSANPGVPPWMLYGRTVIIFGAVLAFIGSFLAYAVFGAEGQTVRIGLFSASGAEAEEVHRTLGKHFATSVGIGVTLICACVAAAGCAVAALFVARRWLAYLTGGVGATAALFIFATGCSFWGLGAALRKAEDAFSALPFVDDVIIRGGPMQNMLILGGLFMLGGAVVTLMVAAVAQRGTAQLDAVQVGAVQSGAVQSGAVQSTVYPTGTM